MGEGRGGGVGRSALHVRAVATVNKVRAVKCLRKETLYKGNRQQMQEKKK